MQTSSPRFAVFALGFRPFYLLAAALAALAVPLWIAEYAGYLGGAGYLSGSLWHAHEMLFGFASAVIVGFLFTAVRNWTNRPTPTRTPLALLAVLWLAGRVLLPIGPGWLAAAVDVAFLPFAALGIAIPLAKSGNRRNYFFVGLLLLIAAANLVFHLGRLGVLPDVGREALHAALYVVIFIIAVMAGRVVPMFTANAIPGARVWRNATLDRAALAGLAVALAAAVVRPDSPVTALLCALAAVLHVLRARGWVPFSTGGTPILWILHLSYAWIPLGLLLHAAAALTPAVPATAALHAFAVGAAGGMIIGMITRTARGHTGLPLQAGAAETAAYALVHAAAVVRVFGIVLLPSHYLATLAVAAALWSAAFLAYLGVYVPILVRPRPDGRPG